MRHGRPAKQCVWLGTGGYCRRCRHAITNSNAKSYTNSDGYAFCVRSDGIANTHRYTDGNTCGNGNCYGHAHRYCNAYSDSDCYSNGNCHGDSDRYHDCNGNINTYSYANTYTYSNTSSTERSEQSQRIGAFKDSNQPTLDR